MKGPLKPIVDAAFDRGTIERRGLFDPAAMAGLKRAFDDGSFTSWSDVWSFVLLEAWLRLNWDSAETERPRSLDAVFPEVRLTPENAPREGDLIAAGRGQ